MRRHLLQQDRGRKQEDACVPIVSALGEVGLGDGALGLLGETRDTVDALGDGFGALDIAIARLRRGWLHAEGDDPVFYDRQAAPDCVAKRLRIGDDVVCRRQQDRRTWEQPLDEARRHHRHGGGVAAHRFEYDCGRLTADGPHLRQDQALVPTAADQDWRAEVDRLILHRAQDGFLE